MVFAILENLLPFYLAWNCSLQTFSVGKSLNFVVWERVKMRLPAQDSLTLNYTICKACMILFACKDWMGSNVNLTGGFLTAPDVMNN